MVIKKIHRVKMLISANLVLVAVVRKSLTESHGKLKTYLTENQKSVKLDTSCILPYLELIL